MNFKFIYTSSILSLALLKTVSAQTINKIDPTPFADNANHWYSISDKNNTINARPGKPRYSPDEIAKIADNIVLYQKKNGGWPKNYDVFAILTPDQKDSLLKAKNSVHTTFDNGTTYTHIAALAIAYRSTRFERYKKAALNGFDFILHAQYPNGGWPQYYPLENKYSRHITFNDGAYCGIMRLLKDVKDRKTEYSFIDSRRRHKLEGAFEKGLDCIVKTQINESGKLTAWCQQHDEITLEPTWARKFEPPAICNKESAELVLFLMTLQHPDKPVINAIENAVQWFRDSKILNTRVKTVEAADMQTPFRKSHTDKVVVTDPSAPPIWTRYYELGTHRPVFCNRDSKLVYSLAEVERERRDGYAWYTYGPQEVLNKYEKWKQQHLADL